ncbi:fibronectin type III domain-containing protein [Flavobacteriales bacterium]|jgi:hypothetical protein|nr:fibronectin type III domain-containing protein [Flavobacteriales bacterium]
MEELFGILLVLVPFVVFGFMFAKHRNETPSFLISIERMSELKNAWTLLLVFTAPLILLYNTVVWAGYSVLIAATFLAWLLKTIFDFIVKWIILPFFRAIKWVWINVFWVPIKIIAKAIFHYLIIWAWDLYKTSFLALNNTYNSNKLRIGFIGSFYSLIILGFSIYLSILFDFELLAMIGLSISVLPILKAAGTITSIIHFNDERNHSEHGARVMKAALNYVLAALLSVVVIHILLSLSLLPDFGLFILGLAINTNVILSFVLITSLFIAFFAQAIFPNYMLENEDNSSLLDSTKSYLNQIKQKGLQILFSIGPSSMVSLLVLLIPAFIVYLSIATADDFKSKVYSEKKIDLVVDKEEANESFKKAMDNFTAVNLDTVQTALEKVIELDIRSQQIDYADSFPKNMIDDPQNITNKHTSSYTDFFPKVIQSSKDDSTRFSDKIVESTNVIANLNERLSEYKKQDWSFIIERKNSKGNNDSWVMVKQGTDISRFVDKSVDEGETYVYRVKAQNSNGKSNWGPEVRKTIDNSDLLSPSSLRVSSESNFRNILSWNDNSINETGFIIERKIGDEEGWSNYASLGSDISQFVDSNITSGYLYSYRVKSTQDETLSNTSNSVSIKVRLKAPTDVKSMANLKSLLLDWSYNYGFSTFGWNYNNNRSAGKVTKNKVSGIIKNTELSFADEIQKMIDSENKNLNDLQKELEFINNKLVMYAELVDYDASQASMLRVFKNISFMLLLLFIALMGGVLMSVVLSYFSNVFYKVFKIRHDEEWYFIQLANNENKNNPLQPLFGLTCFVVILIAVYYGVQSQGDLNVAVEIMSSNE